MKRIITALVAATLVASLAACGQKPQPAPQPPATEQTPQIPAQTQPDVIPSAEQTQEEVPQAVEIARNIIPAEGIHVALPILEGDGDGVQIIDQYYDNIGQVYQSHLDEEITADFTVTYNAGQTISVLRSIVLGEDADETFRAETFDVTTGGLYTSDFLFTVDEQTYTERLTGLVAAALDGQEGLALEWESLCVSTFDKDAFYLTPEGYGVFYQAGTLAQTPVQVIIPYDEISDIFTMPN
ncbi:MAG: hypothetical protein PHS97_05395 [Oscillospiraceae bacterium]|nr:hypothetical protein [Oscillospiraceae bacterium]